MSSSTMHPPRSLLSAARAFLLLLFLACICQLGLAQVTFIHSDVAGSPIVATDSAGKILWKENYRPFGAQQSYPTNTGNRLWFAGKALEQESGLLYMGARYYDPAIGRFLSIDPEPVHPEDPHSFSRYSYANNNPYKYKDPDGRQATTVFSLPPPGMDAQSYTQSVVNGNVMAFEAAATVEGGFGIVALTRAAPKLLFRAGVIRGVEDAAKGVINPSTVRFSQDSAKAAFSEGGSIQEMADALRSGALKADQLPAIRLVEKDGKLFTLDNRRLEAFRRAEMDVPYRMATPQEAAREGWKFTTRNDGMTIRIRGK